MKHNHRYPTNGLITILFLVSALILMFYVFSIGSGRQVHPVCLLIFIIFLWGMLAWISHSLKQEIRNRQEVEISLKKSESALMALSKQAEQLSLAAAEMISMKDKTLVFQKISNAIVDHSDYRRVIISLFKETFPYRDIVGFAGVGKDKIDLIRSVEFPKSVYDSVFEKGIPIGQLSYYIPHTMKHILNQDAILYGQGPPSDRKDAWHPEDNLFVRMNDDKGQLIGVISVDESKSGEIPSDTTIRPLEIFSSLSSQIIILKREQEERRKIEAQLQQAIKMESIGTLAGGIAHHFNNIMGIILGNTQLALEDIPKEHTVHYRLEEITKASLRAAEIVRQLLSFSASTNHQLKPLKIVPVIDETLGLLRSSIPSAIDIHKNYMDPDAMVMADSLQISQAIMNLGINAYQSMVDGSGSIEVIVQKSIIDDQKTLNYNGISPGKYVKITIADTGTGIAPEIINRIFDPYFTTKDTGKGSGMGLAVVVGILKAHHGAIFVDSKPGQGSRFSILLPQA